MRTTTPLEGAMPQSGETAERIEDALTGLGRQSHQLIARMCQEGQSLEDVAAELDLDVTTVAARAVHADRQFRRAYIAPAIAAADNVVCDRYRKRLVAAAVSVHELPTSRHGRTCSGCRAQTAAIAAAASQADTFLNPLASTMFLAPGAVVLADGGDEPEERRRGVPWRIPVGVAFLLLGLLVLVLPSALSPLEAPAQQAGQQIGAGSDGSSDRVGEGGSGLAHEAGGLNESESGTAEPTKEPSEDPTESQDAPAGDPGTTGPGSTDPSATGSTGSGTTTTGGSSQPSSSPSAGGTTPPSEPSPSQPAPSQPSQPSPSQPAPSEPEPTQPSPTPAPSPTPTPAPTTPAPSPDPEPEPEPEPEPDEEESGGLVGDLVGIVDDLLGGLLGTP
ncbi:hypothetical protein IM660_13455 [Ruania alkalisoli]|uniref:Uncharacterized protein n=1 Tax=Ruania alkalisoli TaxID=2779775 RepID=A0A7M1SQF7_9MICO|nr:hypothetical protein [Ruania alkalisoli]QOR69671.1 hypothetical protein IM660_13455 [Ruania alkalisoli]